MSRGRQESTGRTPWWAFVRPEEYLLIVVLATFGVLDHLGVTQLFFKTSFIRAAWDLAEAFMILAVGVAGWRALQNARGRSSDLPWWAVALVVALPICTGGLLAAKVLPIRWNREWLAYGWWAAGAWVALVVAASVAIRLRESGASREAFARTPLRLIWTIGRDLFEFARSWLPCIVLLAAYENSLWLVSRINPNLHDPVMFELDEILFGGHPDVWFQYIVTPRITEIFSFFYDSLYLYPVIIGMALVLQRRMVEFRRFLLAFVLAGYVGFIGYVAVPVIGPAFYYPGIYDVDLATGQGIDRLENKAADEQDSDSRMSFYLLAQKISARESYGGEIPRNCFPSLHTAWAVVLLIYAWRYLRKLFWVILVPLLMLIAATSYLRWHYAVDVLAGALLAWFMATVVPWFDAAWERWKTGRTRSRQGKVSRWSGVRERASLVLLPAFVAFVAIYAQIADSESQRAALAKTLGERFVGTSAPEIHGGEEVGAVFADSWELTGVHLDKVEFRAGDMVEMTLWWKCLEPAEGDWKVFTHLRGVDGRNVANLDHHPVFGAYPLRIWARGDVVRDVVFFRVPYSPAFTVWVGLFSEAEVMKRAPITRSPTPRPAVDDSVEVVRGSVIRP